MSPVRFLASALVLAPVACADDTATPLTTASAGESSTGVTTKLDTGELTGGGGGLCERLGPMGPQKLAIRTAATIRGDPRINGYFLNAGVQLEHFVACLSDQVATWASCPGATYACADMRAAHGGRGISALDFADFVDDLALALAELRRSSAPALTDADVATLLAEFTALAQEIVEDPSNDATLYQRLGRRPGLQLLVGTPEHVDTWLGRLTADAALAGFFADADGLRLATCLVRQLSALDGPLVYGGEVDGPPGAEPGVSAANPCTAMGPAHAGVTNTAMGGAPITAADFIALLGHLSQASAALGVTDTDAALLSSALEPLCPEIASDDLNCPGFAEEELLEANALDELVEDGLYDGTTATMRCHTFEVPADGIDVVAGLRVEVGLDSGHVGDLTLKVLAPDLSAVTLVSRPGLAETADDGTGCGGDSSNLVGTSVLVFETGGAKDAEALGDSLDTSGVVCQDDLACSYAPNKGAAVGGDLASLIGTPAPGSWSLCVGDSCGGFVTTLRAARLHLAQTKT